MLTIISGRPIITRNIPHFISQTTIWALLRKLYDHFSLFFWLISECRNFLQSHYSHTHFVYTNKIRTVSIKNYTKPLEKDELKKQMTSAISFHVVFSPYVNYGLDTYCSLALVKKVPYHLPTLRVECVAALCHYFHEPWLRNCPTEVFKLLRVPELFRACWSAL